MAFSAPDLEISPEEVDERLRAGAVELVDVGEPYEREAGRIEGSRHVELERLALQAETIDRDRPVVFRPWPRRVRARLAQVFRQRAGGTLGRCRAPPMPPRGDQAAHRRPRAATPPRRH